jgi:hypothetical protein
MTHDEDVIRLFQRNAVLDHEAPNPSAAMITEIPMELLDPRLGSEDERVNTWVTRTRRSRAAHR